MVLLSVYLLLTYVVCVEPVTGTHYSISHPATTIVSGPTLRCQEHIFTTHARSLPEINRCN